MSGWGPRLILTVIGKALFFAGVVMAVDVTFVKSLALVIASAVGTGVFAIVVALIGRRDQRSLHDRLDTLESRQLDMAASIGVTQRRSDEQPPPPPIRPAGPPR